MPGAIDDGVGEDSELRESERLLRLGFEQSPVASIVWDTNFRVIAANCAAEKLFGYSSIDAHGKHATFIALVGEHGRVDRAWSELLAGRASESRQDNVTRDGRTIHCEWHSAPLTAADGTFLGVSSVIIDLTDRTRLTATLAQSQKTDAMVQLAGDPRQVRCAEVLVADDEPALRRVVAKVLSREGYTVHLAADGEEAIKKIDELGARLDLVLSDIMMPGCSGYEVAEHASRVAPRAAVLLTSGFVEEPTGRNLRGELRVLWKPVRPTDLIQAVAESLRSRPVHEAAPCATAPEHSSGRGENR